MPKKSEKPQREMTRRQISHWQKETRMQRILMIIGAVVLAAVLIVVGTGIYTSQFRPLNAAAVKVGDKEYNVDYYIDALSYYAKSDYSIYEQYMTFETYLSYLTDITAQRIQLNKLVVDNAVNLDSQIKVGDDEVNKTLKDRNLKSNTAAIDAIRSELLQTKLKDQYFDKLVPASGEQRAVLAMFLESQEQANAIKTRIDKGESFNSIAKELSRESNSKGKEGDFGWVPRGVLPSVMGETSGKLLEDKVFQIEVNTVSILEDKDQSKEFGYWLLKVTETREVTSTPTPTGTPTPTPTPVATTQKHLYGILLGSPEKAKEIKAKLEAGGEGNDFETLAKANSEYTDAATNGGELGWKAKGDMGEAIDAVIFPEAPAQALPVNKISEIVSGSAWSTKGGYWLTQITGIDLNKQITGDNRTTLVAVQQNSWTQKIWEDNQANMQILLTSEQKAYAVEKAAKIQ